jgi:hypothetical protein
MVGSALVPVHALKLPVSKPSLKISVAETEGKRKLLAKKTIKKTEIKVAFLVYIHLSLR